MAGGAGVSADAKTEFGNHGAPRRTIDWNCMKILDYAIAMKN